MYSFIIFTIFLSTSVAIAEPERSALRVQSLKPVTNIDILAKDPSGSEVIYRVPKELLNEIDRLMAKGNISSGAYVTWSRYFIEKKLQMRIPGKIMSVAIQVKGLKPLDAVLPQPLIWTAAHNLKCVLTLIEISKKQNIKLYSLTAVRKQTKDKTGILNLHGVELRVWKAYGQKVHWVDIRDQKSLEDIAADYLDNSQVKAVMSQFGSDTKIIRSIIKLPQNPSNNACVNLRDVF